jgi:hypothetical protein
MCNFKEYHGIEVLKGLYEVPPPPSSFSDLISSHRQTSLGIVHQFRRTLCPLLRTPPTIHLVHGSFLMEPLCSSWADADLVFANSTCFPDELILEIAAKCASLHVGARVITFTTSLRSEYFKVRALLSSGCLSVLSSQCCALFFATDPLQETAVHVLGPRHCLHSREDARL